MDEGAGVIGGVVVTRQGAEDLIHIASATATEEEAAIHMVALEEGRL